MPLLLLIFGIVGCLTNIGIGLAITLVGGILVFVLRCQTTGLDNPEATKGGCRATVGQPDCLAGQFGPCKSAEHFLAFARSSR